ncbi:type II secretion system protein GspD [Fretibacterium sp. OH1220_COT-178]|nr:type II secretion system protein GspD [Fretibacterium sp. OH1220_COT-178]
MRKMHERFLLAFLALSLLAGSCAAPALAAPEGKVEASAPTEEKDLIAAAQAMRKAGLVQFNFKDMELVKFVRFMSELLQENIIVPPNISAKITIISPRPSSLSEARQIMLSTLQMYGFSLQDMGAYSIVRQGGVSPSTDVGRGRGGPGYGEETVTYIVPLDYVTVESVIPALQQAFAQTVVVLPVGNGRDVMLQGRATDVNKGVDLLRKMDTPSSARVSKTYSLKFGDAATVAAQLNAIAQTGGPLQGLSAVADPMSRKVVVVGDRGAISRATAIVKELDVDSKAGDFHVYKLRNIDATAASEQLSKVLAASAMLQPNQEGKYPATVVPDLTTNSLIFAATQRQYDALKKVLEEIDVQAKQVLIRGFIAEVNVTNLDRAGIDWSIVGGQIWDNIMLGGTGQLGEGSVPGQFMSWFSELSKKQELIERNGSTYSVTNYKPLALIYSTIEMLKKYDAVNVLSVPRLMCTDNRESSFQVGQVIPVLKGSTSDIANPGALQQNFDYKDTGLTLTVTPHIRSGNVVALDIKQTTEDVLTATGSVTPVTAKREVKTSVVVGDGETIILGGIVKETEKSLRRRVPGLSYIPLIGGLFQKVSREKEKIDFIIFLTPQIISDPVQMRQATRQAVGVPVSGDLVTVPLSSDRKLDLSPMETEVDRRFRELYQKSLKRR